MVPLPGVHAPLRARAQGVRPLLCERAEAGVSDPATLMSAIEDDCAALDNAAKFLERLAKELAAAEIEYEDAMDRELVKLEDQYEAKGIKLPSERQRDARARRQIEPAIRERYLKLKREKDLVESWGRMREKALSGRQSSLSFLKAEGQAPVQPAWTGRPA